MNIAIVGATGNVGRKILEVLEKKEISIDNLYLLSNETQTIEFLTKGNQIKKIIFLDNLGYRHEITLSLKHG